MNVVWIIGWCCMALAVAFGLFATIQNIRTARGIRERRFVLLNCVAMWVVTVLVFSGVLYLRTPWRYLILVLYFVVVPPAVYFSSFRRQLIQRAEGMFPGRSKQEQARRQQV